MATVADLLAIMEMLDNELETGAGESDESIAITALSQAQHYFELVAASYPRILQDTVNVATAASTEKTTWQSSLRRLDALWYLDANGVPVRKLKRITEMGGHVPSLPWPLQVSMATPGSGAPFGYYGNMKDFYWLPLPDAVYTLRIYGFIKKASFTARANNFLYADEVMHPIAQFANKLLSIGVGDDTIEYDKLSAQLFRPLLRSYRKFDRSEPQGRFYTEAHTT